MGITSGVYASRIIMMLGKTVAKLLRKIKNKQKKASYQFA